MESIKEILSILFTIRLSERMDEQEIHTEIMKSFDKCGILYQHEYKLVPHKRFDFWLDGIVLEIKKEKPSKITLLNQLNKYTKEGQVKAIIVVMEKAMVLPKILNNKPIFVVSLNANWGIAI